MLVGMPHSKSGKPLKTGDRVVLEGTVKAMSCSDDGCNVTLELDAEACAPAHPAVFSLNAKHVELVGDDEAAPLPAPPAA